MPVGSSSSTKENLTISTNSCSDRLDLNVDPFSEEYPPPPQWANLGLQAVELNQHRYLLYFQMRVGVLRYHQ